MGVPDPPKPMKEALKEKGSQRVLVRRSRLFRIAGTPKSHDARPQAGHGPLRDFELSTNQEASQTSKTRADLLVKPVFEEGDQSTQMLHY